MGYASVAEARTAVVAEARTWLGTPYHHYAAIKGAGVDCAMLPIAVYSACGLIEPFDPGRYPPQWFLHRDEERYMGIVRQYAQEVSVALPGDLVLYKVGRCYAHGGIVVDWPMIIHASADDKKVRLQEGNGSWYADQKKHPHKFFSLFEVTA